MGPSRPLLLEPPEATVDPDLELSRPGPVRVQGGGLSPDDVIAQGASASLLVRAPGVATLHARAQVSGATADLLVERLLADKETAAADQDAATGLVVDTEALHSVTAVGTTWFRVTLTNTGAGPDAVVTYLDLFPEFA